VRQQRAEIAPASVAACSFGVPAEHVVNVECTRLISFAKEQFS